MMNLFGDKKKVVSLILDSEMKPKGENNENNIDGLNLCCEDIFKAIESKDAKMLTAGLKAFIDLYEMQEDANEIDSDEGEKAD